MGFILAKQNVFTVEVVRSVSVLIVNWLIPCLIFYNVVTSIGDSEIGLVGVFVLTNFIYESLGLFFAFIVKLVTPNPKYWTGGLIIAGSMTNISDLPIAYVTTLAGGTLFTSMDGTIGTAYSSIFTIVFTFTFFNMGGYRLIERDFKMQLRDIEAGTYDPNRDPEPGIKPLWDMMVKVSKDLFHGARNLKAGKKHKSAEDHPTDHLGGDLVQGTEKKKKPLSENINTSGPRLLVSSATSSSSIHSAVQDYTPNTRSYGSTPARRLSINAGTPIDRKPFIPGAGRVPISVLDDSDSDDSSAVEPVEDMKAVIDAFSQTDRIQKVISRHEHADRDFVPGNLPIEEDSSIANGENFKSLSDQDESLHQVATAPKKKKRNVIKHWFTSHRMGFLWEFFSNFLRPPSMALIVSITICMIPWVRRLFTQPPGGSTLGIPNAPDGRPVLSFFMDFTQFVGNAEVPLGLATLGATISRLNVTSLPKGFWKSVLLMTLLKLAVLPIIAIAWAQKVRSMGWVSHDDYMAMFVMIISSGVPSATSQVYLTAIYTDPNSDKHEEMDCLAVSLIAQYSALVITMTILLTYTLLDVIHF